MCVIANANKTEELAKVCKLSMKLTIDKVKETNA